MSSPVTSVIGLAAYRRTIVACFVFRREISRKAVWDFFDSIRQTRTSYLGAARPLPPSADIGPGGPRASAPLNVTDAIRIAASVIWRMYPFRPPWAGLPQPRSSSIPTA